MLKICFLGDIALNGKYIELAEKDLNPFKSLSPLLNSYDYVIGNLECVLPGNEGENNKKKPRLYTDLRAFKFIKDINLNVACLANNHIYDHLDSGFNNTINFLKKNDILYTGADITTQSTPIPLILRKNNVSIAILNYVTDDTNICRPDKSNIQCNIFKTDEVLKIISDIRDKVHFIFVVLHWGGIVEGGLFPDYHQRKIAKQLIDSGVDLIIGHHSHTIQPYEIYKNKYIFYSIGNFCFSDFYFNGIYHPMPKRRMRTMIIDVAIVDSVDYNVKIHYFQNKLTHFINISYYKFFHKIQNFIYLYFLSRSYILWKLYYLHYKYITLTYFFLVRKDISIYQKLKRIIYSLNRRIKSGKLY